MEGWDFAVEGRFEPQAKAGFQPQAQEAGEFGRRSRAQGRKKGVLPQEGRARSIPGRCRAHKGAFSPPEILDGRSPDRTRRLNVCPQSAPLPQHSPWARQSTQASSSPPPPW